MQIHRRLKFEIPKSQENSSTDSLLLRKGTKFQESKFQHEFSKLCGIRYAVYSIPISKF